MDNSVRNIEDGIQGTHRDTTQGNFQQDASGQTSLGLDVEQNSTENIGKRGPGLKEPAAGQNSEGKQEPPVQQMNPNLKFGRRMDYKTAKVNDKQIKDLNLSLSSLNTPRQVEHKEKPQEEPKSALELELEALEAEAALASQPIHNPLPTPKKRVPKEMEFDIEPPEYAMHFDLVDLNGKDFFDIN